MKFGNGFFPPLGQGEIFRVVPASDTSLSVTINRDTGAVTIGNYTGASISFTSLTISSAFGAIERSAAHGDHRQLRFGGERPGRQQQQLEHHVAGRQPHAVQRSKLGRRRGAGQQRFDHVFACRRLDSIAGGGLACERAPARRDDSGRDRGIHRQRRTGVRAERSRFRRRDSTRATGPSLCRTLTRIYRG